MAMPGNGDRNVTYLLYHDHTQTIAKQIGVRNCPMVGYAHDPSNKMWKNSLRQATGTFKPLYCSTKKAHFHRTDLQ
jgi:hypothetical protein